MSAGTNKFARWFGNAWRGGRWKTVVDQYARLRDLEGVLADILARGGVFSTEFIADPRKAAWDEGRRSLALEITELAGIDPARLRRLIEGNERTST